jgi:hypothetical protein
MNNCHKGLQELSEICRGEFVQRSEGDTLSKKAEQDVGQFQTNDILPRLIAGQTA